MTNNHARNNTFTFQSLLHKSKEHLSTEITEMWRLVGVNVKVVRSYLQLFWLNVRYNMSTAHRIQNSNRHKLATIKHYVVKEVIKSFKCKANLCLFYLYLRGGLPSQPSSAEAVISFGPMRSPEITERLYKSLWDSSKPQKSMRLNFLKFSRLHKVSTKYGVTYHHHGITFA